MQLILCQFIILEDFEKIPPSPVRGFLVSPGTGGGIHKINSFPVRQFHHHRPGKSSPTKGFTPS